MFSTIHRDRLQTTESGLSGQLAACANKKGHPARGQPVFLNLLKKLHIWEREACGIASGFTKRLRLCGLVASFLPRRMCYLCF